MPEMIDDSVIDNIEIVWVATPLPGQTRLKHCPPELTPLHNLFSWWQWKDVNFLAEGVVERSGRSVNDLGFAYPEEIDEEDEQVEGSVQVFDNFDKIYLSEEAFRRLMLRFFKTLYQGAKAEGLSVTKEAWWPDFVDNLDKLENPPD